MKLYRNIECPNKRMIQMSHTEKNKKICDTETIGGH